MTLANGQTIRVDIEAGLQSVYLGRDTLPQFQSRWTATGPKIVGARQHLAFLLDRDRFDGTLVTRRPERNLTGSGGGGGGGDFGLGAIALALTAIHSVLQGAPASQGLGESDGPVMVVKAWALDLPKATPILIDGQTDDQFRQNCKHREIVELWALEAVAKAATYQDLASPQALGTRAHKILKEKVDMMSRQFPELYGNVRAEISFVDDNERPVPYGTKGSSRLDILEDRRRDMGAICTYDMKTGKEGLTLRRLTRIGKLISSVYPGTSLFYVIQVGPMAGGNRAR